MCARQEEIACLTMVYATRGRGVLFLAADRRWEWVCLVSLCCSSRVLTGGCGMAVIGPPQRQPLYALREHQSLPIRHGRGRAAVSFQLRVKTTCRAIRAGRLMLQKCPAQPTLYASYIWAHPQRHEYSPPEFSCRRVSPSARNSFVPSTPLLTSHPQAVRYYYRSTSTHDG